jgi:antitoxin HicB
MSKNIGSKFDDFLEKEGLLEETEAIAAKRVFVYQLEKELERQRITKSDLADRMGTSRSALSRLFDPTKPSTLKSISGAAKAVGKHVSLRLV